MERWIGRWNDGGRKERWSAEISLHLRQHINLPSLSLCLLSGNFALAHGAIALPAVLSQGRRGHRLRRAFCVKSGAGPLLWKFPAKSCDRLARGAA